MIPTAQGADWYARRVGVASHAPAGKVPASCRRHALRVMRQHRGNGRGSEVAAREINKDPPPNNQIALPRARRHGWRRAMACSAELAKFVDGRPAPRLQHLSNSLPAVGMSTSTWVGTFIPSGMTNIPPRILQGILTPAYTPMACAGSCSFGSRAIPSASIHCL